MPGLNSSVLWEGGGAAVAYLGRYKFADAAGRPLAADPANPAYLEHLRRSVTEMLSPDGLDADGFKKAAEAAKEGCPVSQALAVPITLTVN